MEATATFTRWSKLSEELMTHILWFVADAPLEMDSTSPESNLTHVLPFVNKQISTLIKQDFYWKHALQRLVQREPFLWQEGLFHLLQDCDVGPDEENKKQSDSKDLVERGLIALDASMQESFSEPTRIRYFHVFQYVYMRHLRYCGPVFAMPSTVQLGQSFGLHFFEPRYRIMIAEVMDDWPAESRRGVDVRPVTAVPPQKEARTTNTANYPTFVFANNGNLSRGSTACIVRVENCFIHSGGTADVILVPIAYVKIDQCWVRPNARGLHEARIIRMPKAESDKVEADAACSFAREAEREERARMAGGNLFQLHDLLRYVVMQQRTGQGIVEFLHDMWVDDNDDNNNNDDVNEDENDNEHDNENENDGLGNDEGNEDNDGDEEMKTS